MLDLYAPHAPTYLATLMAVTTLALALPIFVVPLTWARVLRWTIPEHTHLAIYFGRCLGAFILLLEWMMWRAVDQGVGVAWTFDALFFVFGSMVLVHLWGVLRRIQPLAETLEIGRWLALLVLNTMFYPAATVATP